MAIRAIFFDFDGVLVDSEPLHYECWAEVLKPHGITLSYPDYCARFIGVSNRAMIESLCRQDDRVFHKEFFNECYEQKRALYEERATTRLKIPLTLIEFFLTHSDKYQLGVVSSSKTSEVEPHLIASGIRQSLAALVCAEDVEKLKPEPDPYLKALELVHAGAGFSIQPEDCLAVEDSGPGAESAKRAGMQVLVVPGPENVITQLRTAIQPEIPR